jgi:hypothetical protein
VYQNEIVFRCLCFRSQIVCPLLRRNTTLMTSLRNLLMKSSRCGFWSHCIDPLDSSCSLHLMCSTLLQENQDLLIRCIVQHLGFAGNRPVAACIIYKCLLHWRSFEVERTSVFDRIIQTIGHAIEVKIIQCNIITGIYIYGC